MFYSQLLLSKKGALGVVWIAAHCYKRLKKEQIQRTDISSSVDKILKDEVPIVTHRILAYLLLGIVRIYLKKVEYLLHDCHDVRKKLCEVNPGKSTHQSSGVSLRRYHSIILPKSFELDAFDLELLEDQDPGGNLRSPEELVLTDGHRKAHRKSASHAKRHFQETSFSETYAEASTPPRDVFSPHRMENSPSYNKDKSEPSLEIFHGSSFSLKNFLEPMILEEADEEPNNDKDTSVDKTDIPGPSRPIGYDSEASPSRNGSDMMPSIEILRGTEFPVEGHSCPKLFEAEKEQMNHIHESQKTTLLETTHDVDVEFVDASHNRCDSVDSLGILIRDDFSIEHPSNMETSSKDESVLDRNKQSDKGHEVEEENLADMRTQLRVQDIKHAFNGSVGKESLLGIERINFQEASTPEIRKHPMSVNVDVTPNSDLPEADLGLSDITTVPTPAPKERGKVLKKRKILMDSTLILQNAVFKKWLDDPSDLKRMKMSIPQTVLECWRAHKLRRIPQSFLDPYIPHISIDLDSLERKKESRKVPAEPLEVSPNQDDLRCPPDATHTVSDLIPDIETPIPERSPVQTPIAPGTPVPLFNISRSFEPGTAADSDIVEPTSSFESREKRPCRREGVDLDAGLSLNEETNSSEGDSVEKDGCSARTRIIGCYLHKNFLARKSQKNEDEVLNFSQLLAGKTKKQSARLFYEILVLKTRDCIDVRQENPYGDILLIQTSKLNQAFES